MFFQSRLFKFLLPLFSYLFFSFLWIYNYKKLWYGNVPEETMYFKNQITGIPAMAAMVGYTFLATFILFLIIGIFNLVMTPVHKFLLYLLIGNLVISAYCVWIYATKFIDPWSNNIPYFLNMVLFAISIFQLTKSTTKS